MIHVDMERWAVKLRNAQIDAEHFNEFSEDVRKTLMKMPLRRHASGVWSAPILSHDGVEFFKSVAEIYHDKFTVNDEEEPQAQIQELVLADWNKPADYISNAIGRDLLAPLFYWLMGDSPDLFHTQIARYSPENTKETCWHLDHDSPFTCVVNLGGEYEGGGTLFHADGPISDPVAVPPVPVGHGVIFNGKYTLHRGMPVTKGERTLLVFWCK